MNVFRIALCAGAILCPLSLAAEEKQKTFPYDEVIVVRPSKTDSTKQGLEQFVGISGKTAGARKLSLNKVVFPPGGSAKAHTHGEYESAIYLLKGKVQTFYGEGLKKSVINEEGDFLFIPPGVPHQPFNLSKTEEAISIVVRNDPEEQVHVTDYKVETPPKPKP